MRLRFGKVRFDADARQLWFGSDERHLSGKAFELLKLLVERRPAAVSKSDIQAHLWPETFVSETNLPSLIAEIRKALGDHARRSTCIRTVHRFGYAFDAIVIEDTVEDGTASRRVASVPVRHWLTGEHGRTALIEGENVMGREGYAIAFDSPTVSRRHARITIDERGAVLEDLGSKNGTYLKDARLTSPARLVDGDQIRVGSVRLTFRMVDSLASTKKDSLSGQRRSSSNQ